MFDSLLHNPIALIFISYAIGAICTDVMKKYEFIDRLRNQNFINDALTRRLGVLHLGWIIRKTILGGFNKKLRLKGKSNRAELLTLIEEMDYAEIGHLIGFFALLILNIALVFMGFAWIYIIVLLLVNIVLNLYLVFLQQFNKRRIKRVLRLT